jgi:ribosomal protein S18 acetylase RimI-like enzyme
MTTIRDAVIEDIPLIRRLAQEIWPSTYGELLSPEQLAYMLDLFYSPAALDTQMREGHRFLILEEDKVPQGFADFSEIDPPGTVKLNKLYVLPSGQGKGWGRQLLEQVIRLSEALEAHAIQLQVKRDNKAKHFYEKMGFRVLHELDLEIGKGYFMRDYVMNYDLPAGGDA